MISALEWKRLRNHEECAPSPPGFPEALLRRAIPFLTGAKENGRRATPQAKKVYDQCETPKRSGISSIAIPRATSYCLDRADRRA
jgi:hypothetical protein